MPLHAARARIPWPGAGLLLPKRLLRPPPVGGADDEHRLLGVHAVHLGQQLVEHAVGGAAGVAAAGSALHRDRVQLVEEEHAGRGLAGLRGRGRGEGGG